MTGSCTRRARSRWVRRCAAAAVLAAFLPLASGACYGKFQLTRNLYTFNRDVSPDQWIQWLIFLGMSGFYGLSVAIDLVIANTWEFWGDENPIESHSARAADGSEVTISARSGGGVDVTIVRPDGTTEQVVIAPEGASLAARDADGRLLARVADLGGHAALVEGAALALP